MKSFGYYIHILLSFNCNIFPEKELWISQFEHLYLHLVLSIFLRPGRLYIFHDCLTMFLVDKVSLILDRTDFFSSVFTTIHERIDTMMYEIRDISVLHPFFEDDVSVSLSHGVEVMTIVWHSGDIVHTSRLLWSESDWSILFLYGCPSHRQKLYRHYT